MWISQKESVSQELSELLPPNVLLTVIRGLTADDAAVAMKCLRTVWPTLASAIGRLDCDAYALRLVVVGDLEMREFDVRGRFLVELASHGTPAVE